MEKMGAYTTMCMLIHLSHIQLFMTIWAVAHQAPLFMGFSRQEDWSGWPLPSPGDLPNPGIEPRSPALQTDFLPFKPPGKPWLPMMGPNSGTISFRT